MDFYSHKEEKLIEEIFGDGLVLGRACDKAIITGNKSKEAALREAIGFMKGYAYGITQEGK